MKRRRKSVSDQDSLDMLLDALCNMFGIIILIALLVIILTSKASKNTADLTSTIEISIETRTLIQEVENKQYRIDSIFGDHPSEQIAMEVAIQLLDDAKEQNEKAINILSKEDKTTALIIQAEIEAQREVDRLMILKEDLEEKLNSPVSEDLIQAIEEELEEIEKIKESINNIDSRRVLQGSRVARENKTDFLPVWVIIENGRAYIVSHGKKGLGQYYPRDVTQTLIDSSKRIYEYNPIRNEGFRVNENVASNSRFRGMLREFPNNEFLFSLWVRGDMHEEFQNIKAALLENGYAYYLSLRDDSFTLRPGRPSQIGM